MERPIYMFLGVFLEPSLTEVERQDRGPGMMSPLPRAVDPSRLCERRGSDLPTGRHLLDGMVRY